MLKMFSQQNEEVVFQTFTAARRPLPPRREVRDCHANIESWLQHYICTDWSRHNS